MAPISLFRETNVAAVTLSRRTISKNKTMEWLVQRNQNVDHDVIQKNSMDLNKEKPW